MPVWIWLLLILLAVFIGWLAGKLYTQTTLLPKIERAEAEQREAAHRFDDLKLAHDEDIAKRDELEQRFENTFKALAGEALSKSSGEFLKQAEERFKALARENDANLDSKKKLIDANLSEMSGTLKGLLEKSTKLEEGLTNSREQTERLRTTTNDLRQVLSNPQKRGQWGERMVEDIINTLGLIEGINYKSQYQMTDGTRPDYTFFLPKEKMVNLDVKFPIDQYEKYIEAENPAEAEAAKRTFLAAVKGHVKDVATRGYIDPSAGTVDYMMVFIPNEAIYGFIHQNEPDLLDFALQKQIILCSPITLYAVLSLIYQAVRNFAVEEQATEIKGYLETFWTQWEKYVQEMDKMGKAIDGAKEKYNNLVSTRSKQLEKPLRKIRNLSHGQQKKLID
ncbi:DNA recombination protein RmuC [Candidatus Neomarinimicrobiota bacterium]